MLQQASSVVALRLIKPTWYAGLLYNLGALLPADWLKNEDEFSIVTVLMAAIR